jgi:hypothetical protein
MHQNYPGQIAIVQALKPLPVRNLPHNNIDVLGLMLLSQLVATLTTVLGRKNNRKNDSHLLQVGENRETILICGEILVTVQCFSATSNKALLGSHIQIMCQYMECHSSSHK